MYLQRLEDAGKSFGELFYKHILASKKFSQSIFFVEEEGFQDQTVLSLFTVPKKKRSLPTSFC